MSPVTRSFTYTSPRESRSAGSRLVAVDMKETLVPSAESHGATLHRLALTPVSDAETVGHLGDSGRRRAHDRVQAVFDAAVGVVRVVATAVHVLMK
jgi:hypothetical protein